MIKGKKGASLDFLVLLFVLVIFSILSIIITFVYGILAEGFPQDKSEVQQVFTNTDAWANSLKYMLIIVIIGSGLVMFVVSVVIPSNPLFAIAGFSLFLISILMSVFANNIFDDFVTSNTQLEAHVDKEYSAVRAIFNNYPYYALIIGGLALIGLTAKRVIVDRQEAG